MAPFLVPLRPLSRALYAARAAIRASRDGVSAAMYDLVSLSGALLFKLFGAPGDAGARIERTGGAVMAAEIGLAHDQPLVPRGLLSVMMAVSSALVWLLGGLLVARGSDVGGRAHLVHRAPGAALRSGRRRWPPRTRSSRWRARCSTASRRTSRSPTENDRAAGAVALPPGGGAIELRSVSFAYEPGVPVLARRLAAASPPGAPSRS